MSSKQDPTKGLRTDSGPLNPRQPIHSSSAAGDVEKSQSHTHTDSEPHQESAHTRESLKKPEGLDPPFSSHAQDGSSNPDPDLTNVDDGKSGAERTNSVKDLRHDSPKNISFADSAALLQEKRP